MRGPVTLLKDAWGVFTTNPKLFIGIYAVPAVITIIWSLFLSEESGTEMSDMSDTSGTVLIAVVVGVVVLTVVNILMGIAMIHAVIDPVRTTVQSAYTFAKKYFWAYLWLSLLVSVVTTLGFILLIIPGIILAVWFSVSYFTLIIENKRGVEAMKASRMYVKGKWWQVFGRLAFLVLVAAAASIIVVAVTAVISVVAGEIGAIIVSLIFNAVLVPVAVAYSYFLYKDLSGSSVSAPNPAM